MCYLVIVFQQLKKTDESELLKGCMEKHVHAHLLSSEDNHHVYAKAPTLAYWFHEPCDDTSLGGIAAFLQSLRLLIQQYFNIVHYIGCTLWQIKSQNDRLRSFQQTWQATEMSNSPIAAWILLHCERCVILRYCP